MGDFEMENLHKNFHFVRVCNQCFIWWNGIKIFKQMIFVTLIFLFEYLLKNFDICSKST